MPKEVKRVVSTAFWSDEKVEEFTPEDRYFLLYLLTNPWTTQLGIYKLSIKRAAYETGYSMETVKSLLERFEKIHGLIIYSPATGEIAIKNFLRHSIVKGGKPVEDCLKKEIGAVKEKSLIDAVFQHIGGDEKLNASVANVIKYYNSSFNSLNENDNENENERIVDDSYNDSSPAPEKKAFGEYKNVFLTDDEFQSLKDEYPYDWAVMIGNLSGKIASKGYTFASHYATLREWAKEDAEKPKDSGRKEIVPSWMDDSADDIEFRRYQATIANDPEIAARAEALRQKLSTKGNAI